MSGIVGVRLGRSDRVRYYDPGEFDLSVGDHVIVDTEDGSREGQVVVAPSQFLHSDLRGPLNPVLRKVNE